MLTQCGDVVKQITFDVNTPIDTVFNNVKELLDIILKPPILPQNHAYPHSLEITPLKLQA